MLTKITNQLFSQKQPRKNKLISVISSSNVFTTEYKARSNFITKLKDYFGDKKIDVFGKQIRKILKSIGLKNQDSFSNPLIKNNFYHIRDN